MAELKASELKYSVPLVTKVGGLLFTATQVETPANAEYAPEGALFLNLEKLGLTDQAISGVAEVAGALATVGEVATTTALPAFAWCSPLVVAKASNESGKPLTVAFPATVSQIEGKLCLRIFSQETAGIGKPMLEPKTSTKAAVSSCVCTVFCLGK